MRLYRVMHAHTTQPCWWKRKERSTLPAQIAMARPNVFNLENTYVLYVHIGHEVPDS